MVSTSISLAFGVVVLGVIFAYSQSLIRPATASEKYGLPPIRPTYDPLLGLGYKVTDIMSMARARSLPEGQALHKRLGHTYCERSVFGMTVKTACEKNIHSIFGSDSKIWGVGPARYEGFRPFCGAGLLSTDGSTWERSRRLLKPFFQKSAISNLDNFETLVGDFIQHLPDDGSTIDLEPLFSKLVSVPSCLREDQESDNFYFSLQIVARFWYLDSH